MKITFDHSKQETPHVVTFYFRPDKQVQYKPGQYIELTLTHSDPDDRGVKRFFTLSSSPTETLLSITTKVLTDGSTFTKALQNLTLGDVLEMSEPRGSFILPEDVTKPLVFAAGGIGVTPFRSMLTWLAAAKQLRPIKLLYAVETEEDVIFRPLVDQLSMDATIVVGNPSSDWSGACGRLTPELIADTKRLLNDASIYISGPAGMVESLYDGLQRIGVKQQDIVLDAFVGYQNQ